MTGTTPTPFYTAVVAHRFILERNEGSAQLSGGHIWRPRRSTSRLSPQPTHNTPMCGCSGRKKMLRSCSGRYEPSHATAGRSCSDRRLRRCPTRKPWMGIARILSFAHVADRVCVLLVADDDARLQRQRIVGVVRPRSPPKASSPPVWTTRMPRTPSASATASKKLGSSRTSRNFLLAAGGGC